MDEQLTPQANETETSRDWKHHFTTVTPVSKFFAMLLFIALPFVGFWQGVKYAYNDSLERNLNITQPSTDILSDERITRTSELSAQNRVEWEDRDGQWGGMILIQNEINYPICGHFDPAELDLSETAEWATYHNNEYGFSLKYPKDLTPNHFASGTNQNYHYYQIASNPNKETFGFNPGKTFLWSMDDSWSLEILTPLQPPSPSVDPCTTTHGDYVACVNRILTIPGTLQSWVASVVNSGSHLEDRIYVIEKTDGTTFTFRPSVASESTESSFCDFAQRGYLLDKIVGTLSFSELDPVFAQ